MRPSRNYLRLPRKIGTLGQTRTDTDLFLRQVPLQLGYEGVDWRTVWVPIPSRRLERPPASPAAHGSCLVMLRGLEPRMPRVRGVLLEPLCIEHRIGFGASSRELRPSANRAELATTGYLHLSETGAAACSRTKQAPLEARGLQPRRGPSPVYRYMVGAPRSARTFVSPSSAGRLSYLSYRGKLVELLVIETRRCCLQGRPASQRTTPVWCPTSGIEPCPTAL